MSEIAGLVPPKWLMYVGCSHWKKNHSCSKDEVGAMSALGRSTAQYLLICKEKKHSELCIHAIWLSGVTTSDYHISDSLNWHPVCSWIPGFVLLEHICQCTFIQLVRSWIVPSVNQCRWSGSDWENHLKNALLIWRKNANANAPLLLQKINPNRRRTF